MTMIIQKNNKMVIEAMRTINPKSSAKDIAHKVIDWFKGRCKLKILKTTVLRDVAHKVAMATQMSNHKKKIFDTVIREGAKEINLEFCLHTKHAPVINQKNLFQLVIDVWNDNTNLYKHNLITRKTAALHLILAVATGCRWVDLTRIKWDKFMVSKKSYGIFIRFMLPFTKTDPFNKNSKTITICSVENRKFCPVYYLMKYWILMGKPTNGFILVNDQGMQTNGDATFHQIKRQSRRQRWKIQPTKHTPRVSMATLLALKGVKKERILESLNWSHNSEMLATYLNWRLSENENSPAAIWAKEMNTKDAFKIVEGVPL